MRSVSIILLLFLMNCHGTPKIDGFDPTKWQSSKVCSEYRINGAVVLESNEHKLQGMIQKEIESLLGKSPRLELGKRSEQFFKYPITKNCDDSTANTSLSFRFDALGRVKEVQILLED